MEDKNKAYKKMEVKEACDMCGIAIPIGYLWLRKWNKEGYEGLKDKEGKRDSETYVLDNKRSKNTHKKERFAVEYSEDQVVRILRDKIGMKFSKPYPRDYRRPADAEQILENQLKLTFT